jgi:hypothetical protein
MTNTPPLVTGTVVHHSNFGKGKIICQYEDSTVGDMVEVHWLDKNEVLDHREENLRFGLTTVSPPARSISPWVALVSQE